MVRYRKSIACLTTNELHDFREALTELYSLPEKARNSFLHIAGIHGLPSPMWCIHGSPGFLTWHRAYLAVFEEALREVKPNISLPYWDWSSRPSQGLPAACSSPTYIDRSGKTVENPLYRGPLPTTIRNGGHTSRRVVIDTTSFGDLADQAQSAMKHTDFSIFQSSISTVHDSVHIRVGGNMAQAVTAAFDPLFYLHHANVDRLWANWQSNHSSALASNEASQSLEPFKKCFSDEFYKGTDMESTDKLGYRYQNFCLIPFPPAIPFEPMQAIQVRRALLPSWANLNSAQIKVVSPQMSMRSLELRFFMGNDEVSADTRLEGSPAFLGSFGVFGMTSEGMDMHMLRGIAMPERRGTLERQIDVTKRLQRLVKSSSDLILKVIAVTPEGEEVDQDTLQQIWESWELQLLVN